MFPIALIFEVVHLLLASIGLFFSAWNVIDDYRDFRGVDPKHDPASAYMLARWWLDSAVYAMMWQLMNVVVAVILLNAAPPPMPESGAQWVPELARAAVVLYMLVLFGVVLILSKSLERRLLRLKLLES